LFHCSSSLSFFLFSLHRTGGNDFPYPYITIFNSL
jgi:hypothetical protein